MGQKNQAFGSTVQDVRRNLREPASCCCVLQLHQGNHWMDQTVAGTSARQGHKWIIWATLIVALTLWIVINSIHYQQLRDDVLRYGKQQLAETLRVHSAIHRFVEEEQKPIVYALQDSGNIDHDWFSPGLLSGTYIARRIQEEINVERAEQAIPEISFRLAAINARNPVNEANDYEAAAIRRDGT